MSTACDHRQSQLTPLFDARDYVSGEVFSVRGCAVCGLALTTPPARPIAAYYPASYYKQEGAARFPRAVEWLQQRLYEARARKVERLLGRRGRVLDIGCGPGLQLEAFRARGWEVHGCELSDGAAACARERGIPVQVGPAEKWPWPDGSFDAVVLWHVLEHHADPQAALEQARRLLMPGGLLLLGVPNFGSPEARVTRQGWFHLDVPRHLSHFTPRALTQTLSEAGLTLRELSFLAPEFDAFSFVQSVESRLGLPHNLLYDLLRSGTGRRQLIRSAPLSAALSLLFAVPLTVLAVPLTLLLGLAGAGSSMTALAVHKSAA
jgi:SAM-dependent methyltransferase